MLLSRQPDCAFHQFIDEIKPSIQAFSPHAPTLWWEPYCLLLGMRQGTIFKWRNWRKLPDDAYQNVSNLLALQEIAFLPDTATAEDARDIARRRLSDALAPLPVPKTPKPRRPRAPATDPSFRRRRRMACRQPVRWRTVPGRYRGGHGMQPADRPAAAGAGSRQPFATCGTFLAASGYQSQRKTVRLKAVSAASLLAVATAMLAISATAAMGQLSVVQGPVEADVIRVLDGDSFEARVYPWPDMVVVEMFRIYGIDTPELRSRCQQEKDLAQSAKQFVANLIVQANNRIKLSVVGCNAAEGGGFGRCLATVHAGGISVGDALIAEGLARPNFGEARLPWCD
jgi:micrococcal nuclease